MMFGKPLVERSHDFNLSRVIRVACVAGSVIAVVALPAPSGGQSTTDPALGARGTTKARLIPIDSASRWSTRRLASASAEHSNARDAKDDFDFARLCVACGAVGCVASAFTNVSSSLASRDADWESSRREAKEARSGGMASTTARRLRRRAVRMKRLFVGLLFL